MADDTNASTEAPVQESDSTGGEQSLGDAGKKALDTERQARRDAEARLKEFEPQLARLKELEDAQKSDAERQTEALTAISAERDQFAADAARLRAAVKHGLSDDDLDLLGTGTPDEIEGRAAKLAERLAASGQPRTPRPDPTQGRSTNTPSSTADEFAAFIESQL